MVSDDIIKKYATKESADLRIYCVALDVENNVLRAQLQSLKEERNKLLRQVSGVDLSSSDRPVPVQTLGSSLPPVPRLNPRP